MKPPRDRQRVRLVFACLVVCLVFWLALGVRAVHADTVPYRLFTSFDGLPSEHVNCVAQSSSGLLWVGTENGLAVYDGHQFRTVALPDSVGESNVKHLQPVADGSVWVGVGTFRPTVMQVRPFGVQRVVELGSSGATLSRLLVRDGTVVVVTTRAVWTLPPSADRPTRIPLQYAVRPPSEAKGASPDVGVGAWDAALGPDGSVWILDGRRGPGRLRPDGSVVFTGAPIKEQGQFWTNFRFTEDGTGILTQGPNLYRFDPATYDRTVVLTDLSRFSTKVQDRVVYLRRNHRLVRYDVASRDVRQSLGPNVGLPDRAPRCVLRGQNGGLWIGTTGGLVYVMDPEVRHVQTVGGTSLEYVGRFMGHGRQLWVTTWGRGLVQLRPERRPLTPDGRELWLPLRARDETLHALSDTEWYRWTPAEGWEWVRTAEDAVRGFVDSSGAGVFWHDDGLFRHAAEPGRDPVQLASWPSDHRSRHASALAPNGDPVLRAEEHLIRLDSERPSARDTIATIPAHADASGLHMQADPSGRVWCALMDKGLLRVDLATGGHRLLLDGVSVHEPYVVGDSLLLATSDDGLFVMNSRSGTVRRHLTEGDGLLSNVTVGAHLTRDTLYVSHQGGLTLLPADGLQSTSSSPPALLTGLEVNLDARGGTGDSVLAASERTVGFSYTAPELVHPDRVRYEVRLIPRDDAWHATRRDFTRYTDLDPGTYRFDVRARLEGAPPGPSASYAFVVSPYFYETWWFRIVLAIAVLGGGVAAYRWRTRRMRRRQEELEAAVTARTEDLAEAKRKTERQAERLAELDEAKNRFFAHISHEFRTPLSLILTPLKRAVDQASTETVAFGRSHVERMLHSAQRLRRLIDQLLDLATLEAGEMELDRRPGTLSTFVRRTAEAFASMAEREGIDLRVQTRAAIRTRFDPDKLESIVSNLLSNALKFTPKDGRVTVRVRRRAATRLDGGEGYEEAVIEVADTGPGMDAETRERIFERFEHVDGSTTREHEGAGLGLALTRELVDLHGGSIDVASTPGEGTTFTVRLPIVPVGDDEAEAVDPVRQGRNLPPAEAEHDRALSDVSGEILQAEVDGTPGADDDSATILIVEDSPGMRAYLGVHLYDRWSVRLATDGAEGWKAIQDEAPDLVLSDVMMPEMDGYELCERIKEDDDLRTIPVILLTARSESEAAVEGLDCGADDYLAKPFDMDELQQRIANHLDTREYLQDEYRQEVRLEPLDAVVDEDDVSFLETVTTAVEARLDDPDLTVEDLAEAAALSRRQLTRRLKSAIGTTPAAFVRERRIERAKELLAEEPETVAEVAYAVGFRSASAFSKTFREHVGCTPSAYVEQQVE